MIDGRSSALAASIGGRDRGHVGAVLDPLRVPAVGRVPPEHVLAERPCRRPVELDPVVVVQDDQPAQSQVAGDRARLGRHALLHVPVAGDHVGPVVDDVVAGAVELGGEPPLGDRHPHRVAEALAERAGGRLDPGRQAVLGVARRDRAPLAERLEVVEADVVPGQVQERVQQHRRVTRRQHEAVAVGPVRVGRRVAEVARPHRIGHRRGAHGRARVPGVGLLDAVDREGPDGVDRESIELVRGEGHRSLRWRGPDRCAGRASSARTARRVFAAIPIVARNAAHPGGYPPGHA